MPQAGLGIAVSFGVPMAFAAQREVLPGEAWALMAVTFFWIIAYDTEYAMVDREDDLKIGVNSSAIVLGRFDVPAVMLCHAVFLAGMAAIGAWYRLGLPFYCGLLAAAGLVGYQYWLIRDRNRDGCFRAFLNNNLVGAAIFTGIMFDLLTRFYVTIVQ